MKIILDIGPLLVESVGVRSYTINLVRNLLHLNEGRDYLLFPFLTEKTRRYFEGLNYQSLLVKESYRKWFYAVLSVFAGSLVAKRLGHCDIFWTPGTFLLPIKSPIAATVFDLTTMIFPGFHKREVVEHHKKIFRYLENKASLIIAISENTKRDIMEHLAIPEQKIRTIYCGVGDEFQKIQDEDYLKHRLKAMGIDYPYLLYVGTLEPRKNIDRLIEAFIQLKKRNRLDLKLVISGTQGWGFQSIFEKIASSGIGNEIVFTGFAPTESLPFLYNGASAFVYPSLYEGFGLPVLEAMACGVPVVTSNVSSLPEVAGNAAVLVNPYSVEELSDGINRVLIDANLRERCVVKGLARAKSFTWKRCALETLKAFEEASGFQTTFDPQKK